MNLHGTMRGFKQMAEKLRAVQKEQPQRIAQALYQEAQIELTESKRRCPVDVSEDAPHPGQLRASGRVSEPQNVNGVITVYISYGGGAVDYAIYVHEILENIHKVGQAKFLESVLNESRPYMAERLARRLQMNAIHQAAASEGEED